MDLRGAYTLADPFSHAVGFWLWVLLGTVLGVVLYCLLAHPEMRRPQCRDGWRDVSRRTAVLAGSGLALLMAACGYWWIRGGFFAVATAEDHLELSYHFPARTVLIPSDQVEEIREGWTLDRGDRRTICVRTKDGRCYQSVSAPYYRLEPVFEDLEAWKAKRDR